MKARVVSKKGAHYVFLGRELTLSALDLNITVKGQELTLTPNRPLTVFDGQLDGALTVTLVEDPAYDTRLRFKNNDFGALMKTFFHNDKVTGRIGGELVLRGAFSDWKTMRGHGTLTVRDGALYNIPFLGGLSDLLNVIIPDMGYAKASEAESKFTVSDGVIQMSRLDIHSLFFVLIGHGHYDFIGDNLELDMRVNLRGAPGVATWLLSKMFEYHGTGPITKTKWETKNF
ncbi:MAG: AsmA-like C-terminal region-containing protein [Verrucomicrobiales bacterium]|nr:AsmA-like C-terminal region-containing protein [Verrucomicrobiales bacterium]